MDKKTFFVVFGLMVGIGIMAVMAGSFVPGNKPFGDQTSQNKSSSKVKLYFVKLNDKGKTGSALGCGDSLVETTTTIVGDAQTKNVLGSLLAVKEREYGSDKYYNSLSTSQLSVSEVKIENNRVQVYLTGKLLLGGTCDSPRIKGQLEETVRSSSGLRNVQIFINNKNLDDVLSGKG